MSNVYTFSRIEAKTTLHGKIDLQVKLWSFQNLENLIILIEKQNMFTIARVLLRNVMSFYEFDELYKEAKWLERNANEYKQNPTMGG